MLCYVILCYVMLCYVRLCYFILSYLMLDHVYLSLAVSSTSSTIKTADWAQYNLDHMVALLPLIGRLGYSSDGLLLEEWTNQFMEERDSLKHDPSARAISLEQQTLWTANSH